MTTHTTPHDPARDATSRLALGRDDRGSQAIELILVTPLVLLLLGTVLAAAHVGVVRIHAQQSAGLAADIAAVGDDHAVLDAVATTGYRIESIVPPHALRRPGDLVTVVLGRDVDIPGLADQHLQVRAAASALTQRGAPP